MVWGFFPSDPLSGKYCIFFRLCLFAPLGKWIQKPGNWWSSEKFSLLIRCFSRLFARSPLSGLPSLSEDCGVCRFKPGYLITVILNYKFSWDVLGASRPLGSCESLCVKFAELSVSTILKHIWHCVWSVSTLNALVSYNLLCVKCAEKDLVDIMSNWLA